jgi:hypothetical protein
MLGSLDEIVTFNRALSVSEIAAMSSAGTAGMVRAPEFTGGAVFANGQFVINLRGQTGKAFTMESSTNLATWTFFSTLSNPTGATQFPDNTANTPNKFYRARQP